MAKHWTSALESLPWRGPAEERPELPLPPGKMPIRFAGTWRKRWRYVGAYGEQVMLCAAKVRIGPFGQTFWAILDRRSGEVIEHTKQLRPSQRGEVWTERGGGDQGLGSGHDRDAPANADPRRRRHGQARLLRLRRLGGVGLPERRRWLRLDPQATVLDRADVDLGERGRIRETLRGIEDESAGYHPHHTVWSWSAGVGACADGRNVAWNLVEGVNDPAAGASGRSGSTARTHRASPARSASTVSTGSRFEDGTRLGFAADAERQAEENRFVVKYSYRQPFGRFSGSLAGLELAQGIGVMEHQDAVW